MDLGLKDKVAVITGGSEGIGRATANSLAREGARVVVCARRVDVLQKAVDEIAENTGAELVAVQAGGPHGADMARLIQAGVVRLGQLNILVNNAGLSQARAFESV